MVDRGRRRNKGKGGEMKRKKGQEKQKGEKVDPSVCCPNL